MAAAALFGREIVKQYIKFKAAPAAARAYYKVSSSADQLKAFNQGSIVFVLFCHYAFAQMSSEAAQSLLVKSWLHQIVSDLIKSDVHPTC